MKKRLWEKIYARIEDLDKAELNSLVQRIGKERRLLDSIFNLLQESILLVDDAGAIEFFNEAAMRLLGLSKKMKQRPLLWKLIPEIASLFSRESCSLTPDIVSKEVELFYPENRSVRLHLQPFIDESMEDRRFIVILNDVTEEKRASEERLMQERLDSVVQLASEVAHELGNPLNSIHIHLQLIERKCAENSLPENIVRSVAICSEEVKRLDEIIKHFLKAVRPKAINLTDTHLVHILEKVLSVLSPQLQNLNIQIEIEAKEEIPSVKVDAGRIHQAFFNVLKNAMEAIGSNGWIRISLFTDGSHLLVAIADSGQGVVDKQAAKMFQKPGISSSKENGHGIGMLIVRRIMKEHGGKVELESKVGMGTVMTLKFPLQNKRFKLLETN